MTTKGKLEQLLYAADLPSIQEQTGISLQLLRRYRAGHIEPSLGFAAKLCRVLGVDMEWLTDDALGFPPRSISQGMERQRLLDYLQLALDLMTTQDLIDMAKLAGIKLAARQTMQEEASRA